MSNPTLASTCDADYTDSYFALGVGSLVATQNWTDDGLGGGVWEVTAIAKPACLPPGAPQGNYLPTLELGRTGGGLSFSIDAEGGNEFFPTTIDVIDPLGTTVLHMDAPSVSGCTPAPYTIGSGTNPVEVTMLCCGGICRVNIDGYTGDAPATTITVTVTRIP